MNNMDDIAYWVHTKRAPCLYGYDKTKKQNEQAHCSKNKSKVNAVKEVPSPKKKNKRKLVLIDDDSHSSEKGESGNFFTSDDQKQHHASKNGKPAPSTSVGSDIDFNIKNSSIKVKPKRMRLQKGGKLSYVKKNNIVTSTPKVTALRRSSRKSQKNLNNNSQLDNSFEILNKTYTIGDLQSPQIKTENKHTGKPLDTNHLVTDSDNVRMPDQSMENVNEKLKNETVLNGQFEDMSDVSGFTANYIRSTKLNSSKTPRNVRNKVNKNFIKESQQSPHKEDAKMVLCVNKSVNTGLPDSTVLNCSTDSSQNVINLVTVKNSDKSTRVSRGTSLLKFLDPQHLENKESLPNCEVKPDINVSFQSNGNSRYPTRRRNAVVTPVKMNHTKYNPDRRKEISCEPNNSDRKESPDKELVSRTRSGRKIGLQIKQPENSVLVLSNSTDQASSVGAVNVAEATEKFLGEDSTKRKRYSGRCTQAKKTADKSRQSLKRDKSGFAECFSESDDDSELLKQRKFFC